MSQGETVPEITWIVRAERDDPGGDPARKAYAQVPVSWDELALGGPEMFDAIERAVIAELDRIQGGDPPAG